MTAGSNTQKTPIGRSLNLVGIRSSETRNYQNGRCFPCSVVSVSGAIVTVKFEMQSNIFTLPQLQMPLFGSEYIRYPIQVGDKGMAVPADAFLGEMSGLGDGRADMREMPNLTSLVFLPMGNKNWSTTDANKVTIYGINGVVLRDKDSAVTLTLTQTGITIDLHGHGPVTIQNGDLRVTGTITAGYGTAGSVTLQGHRHGTGTNAAGTVVPTPGT